MLAGSQHCLLCVDYSEVVLDQDCLYLLYCLTAFQADFMPVCVSLLQAMHDPLCFSSYQRAVHEALHTSKLLPPYMALSCHWRHMQSGSPVDMVA